MKVYTLHYLANQFHVKQGGLVVGKLASYNKYACCYLCLCASNYTKQKDLGCKKVEANQKQQSSQYSYN